MGVAPRTGAEGGPPRMGGGPSMPGAGDGNAGPSNFYSIAAGSAGSYSQNRAAPSVTQLENAMSGVSMTGPPPMGVPGAGPGVHGMAPAMSPGAA
eukprot:7985335-Prorocentrum_lima.AAC.1